MKVVSGTQSDDDTLLTITTAPVLESVPASHTVYGQVYMADGLTPATDVQVYLTLQDADGLGDTGESALLSVLTDENGYWHANLGNARSSTGLFDYSASGDELLIDVQGAETALKVDTANLWPASDIILETLTPTSITVGAFESSSSHASWLAIALGLMLAGTLLVWRRRSR